LEFDQETHQGSLVGLFMSQRFREYPSPPIDFTVYGILFDGIGEGTLELAVQHVNTAKDIHRAQRWITFPDSFSSLHMQIKIHHCVFPGPGRYDLTLRFDGQEVTHRFLDVYQD